MFAKKFLSLLSTLFIGSQLVSRAFAACTINCDHTLSSCTIDNDCEDNAYYSLFAANDESGTAYEFSKTATSYGKVIKVTSKADNEFTEAADGYYKNGADYFISKQGTTVTVAAVDPAIALSYTDGNYYLITSTSTVFTGTAENRVVVLAKDNAITKVTLGTGSYLVKNKVAAVSTVDNVIAVKVDDDEIVLDGDINSEQEYCVDGTTKEITTREVNFCDSNVSGVNCDKYYLCTTGVCVDKTTAFDPRDVAPIEPTVTCTNTIGLSSCADGDFYITDSGTTDLKTGTGAGDLYSCKTTGVNTVTCTIETALVGYVKNADTTNASAIPYIQCSATGTAANSCQAIAQPTANACTDPAAGVGALIYNSEYFVCIDGTTPVALSSDGSYLINAGTASTFENTGVKNIYSVVAKIDGGNVIRKVQDEKKYIYVVKATKRVYAKGESGASAAICSGTSFVAGAAEYVLNQTEGDLVDYYKENN